MQDRSERQRASHLVGGTLLLAVGGLFALQNLGIVHAGRIGDYWPLLLVWMGLARLLAPKRAHHFASGAVLLALGVLFQLERLGAIGFRLREVWPFLLVVAGVALIAESFAARRSNGGLRGPGSFAGPAPGGRP